MFLIKSFTFNPVQENTYLLHNESGACIIIDPGCYYDFEKDTLFTYIEKKGLIPEKLINTHCHLDHIFGNKSVAEKYNLLLHIHKSEKPVFDYGPTSGIMYDLPFDNYTGQIVWIEEGDKIRLGSDELQAIHVPGHSPGSLCFYCKKQDFLIGGDVLFFHSIGRYDLPLGDGPALTKNIREKLFPLPKKTVVYPGHGPMTTIGEEKANNPFLV